MRCKMDAGAINRKTHALVRYATLIKSGPSVTKRLILTSWKYMYLEAKTASLIFNNDATGAGAVETFFDRFADFLTRWLKLLIAWD